VTVRKPEAEEDENEFVTYQENGEGFIDV